jgi:hypothetical protein
MLQLAVKYYYDLFTKFTFLFTIQITQSKKYQPRLAESI